MNARALPAGGRFTAYFPDERELLAARARAEGCSENYLVRTALRALLGLPVPRWAREELAANLDERNAA